LLRRKPRPCQNQTPVNKLVSILLIGTPLFGMVLLLRASDPSPRPPNTELREGGIIRGPRDRKQIALAFTGHGFAEGGATILSALSIHHAKGSFFLTGDFLANTNFHSLVQRLVRDGHYLGPHSDKHVLYCPWEGPKTTLVSRPAFESDLESNLRKIERFGVKRAQIRYFLPPYEHYNAEIVGWAKGMGLTLVDYTPGTRSNADYTGEADKNFVSSKTIFDSIVAKDQQDPNGLNGFILLLHIGSGPGRADKFHSRFGDLLDYLANKGYQLVRIDDLLSTP
jgi:endoglucanase